ncbi:hypothetical protein M5K25_019976 [Dendrobium thyrsiflorum]|uniref:Uncharacterized protein n=1 Tax=Dendrobium thyrsiflorum TaxID=117978 RepID=A0ABD0UH42_DENTH
MKNITAFIREIFMNNHDMVRMMLSSSPKKKLTLLLKIGNYLWLATRLGEDLSIRPYLQQSVRLGSSKIEAEITLAHVYEQFAYLLEIKPFLVLAFAALFSLCQARASSISRLAVYLLRIESCVSLVGVPPIPYTFFFMLMDGLIAEPVYQDNMIEQLSDK